MLTKEGEIMSARSVAVIPALGPIGRRRADGVRTRPDSQNETRTC